ncbi:amino acid/peptide transporter [Peptacetobacter hiranonis DSM 13275]|uniref:Amino acid/peptide transporter n=2 Tax=Peptacetobacter TaxID=2743582 RepID=B6G0V7_PEPHT|nr:amino acid/peptide transporter [Peptacetobacter hiranonis DSM 13275]QEK21645.1 Di-/tripeptide transporter [Peptacetobacter hiranonis]
MTADVAQNGLGLSVAKASSIIGLYTAINYMGSIFGGWITDNYLGIQKSLILGSFLNGLAFIVMFFAPATVAGIWSGLIILIVAGMFFKGQIGALIGSLYGPTEFTRKDAAFALYYMAINIGAFFGPIISGLIADQWFAEIAATGEIVSFGYKYVFLMNGILMIGVSIFIYLTAPKLLGDVAKYPVNGKGAAKEAKEAGKKEVVEHQPLTQTEKKRILSMVILFVFVVLFWSAWFQTQSSFSILMNDLVQRQYGSFTIPVPWLVAYNSILCVIFAPLMAKLWLKLGQSKRGDLSIPTKMALGMLLTASAFVVLILGIRTLGGVLDGSAKMSILFVLLAYFLLTIGELCISPIGMAMFNKLAPVRYGSLAMGAWYLSNFFANLLSGKLAGLTSTMGYVQIFGTISGVLIVFAIMLFILRKKLVKLMALDEFKNK